jgi:hypothetical protein
MSVTLQSNAASVARPVPEQAKDGPPYQTAGDSAFANMLGKINPANDAALISGRPGNIVIPAVLIDAGVDQAMPQSSDAADTPVEIAESSDATAEFLAYSKKTPAEKIRAMVLAEMGLTEETLASLEPEARAEIEEKIRIRIEAKIRQEIEEKSGVSLNGAATSLLPA